MKPLLSSSQRYYQHRKIRRLGYRMDARKRTIYIPANTPPSNELLRISEKLGRGNYNLQTEIE